MVRSAVVSATLSLCTAGCFGTSSESPAVAETEDGLRHRRCGNGRCDGSESCSSCPADCGACSTCGDGVCDASESCGTCEHDCGTCRVSDVCGDGACTGSETCSACSG